MTFAIAYTFNANGTYQVAQTETFSGLNFVINSRFPSDDGLSYPTVIIHPHGVVPDLASFSASSFEVKEGHKYKIGVNVDTTNVTDSFAAMDERQRKCKLNLGQDAKYKRINCKMMKSIEKALQVCQCSPWFFEGEHQNICDAKGTLCFDEVVSNLSRRSWNIECPLECIYSEYALSIVETQMPDRGAIFNELRSSFGNKWYQYLSEDNPMLEPIVYYGGGFTDDMVSKSAMVHVNFQKPMGTITIKDAKMTLAEKIGNIGGTFGVFVGLSFVGIMDLVIIFLRWVRDTILNTFQNKL